MSIKPKLQNKDWTAALNELKKTVEKCESPIEACSEITIAFTGLPRDTQETEKFVSDCVELLICKIADHGPTNTETWSVYLRMLNGVKEFQSYDVEPYSIRIVKQLLEVSYCMDDDCLEDIFNQIRNHFGNDHEMTEAVGSWCREESFLWGL